MIAGGRQIGEIAELTNKNHFDLMRAIRKMEPAWEKVNGCKFALVEYHDKKIPYTKKAATLMTAR